MTEPDLVKVRTATRQWAKKLGMSLITQTKIITAASELARNVLDWGGGGQVDFEVIVKNGNKGLQLSFQDNGPGIEDIELALKDGYSQGSGLGLGLGGSKRLIDEFEIKSKPGQGTLAVIREML